EIFAVERKGARGEGNGRDVFDAAAIDARDLPFLGFVRHVFVLNAANDEDRAIDEREPADFFADVDLAEHISFFVEFQDVLLVPLAHVEMLAVKSEIGAGEVRTGEQSSKS